MFQHGPEIPILHPRDYIKPNEIIGMFSTFGGKKAYLNE